MVSADFAAYRDHPPTRIQTEWDKERFSLLKTVASFREARSHKVRLKHIKIKTQTDKNSFYKTILQQMKT